MKAMFALVTSLVVASVACSQTQGGGGGHTGWTPVSYTGPMSVSTPTNITCSHTGLASLTWSGTDWDLFSKDGAQASWLNTYLDFTESFTGSHDGISLTNYDGTGRSSVEEEDGYTEYWGVSTTNATSGIYFNKNGDNRWFYSNGSRCDNEVYSDYNKLMVLPVLIINVVWATQQGLPIRTRVFPGGSYEAFVRFLQVCHIIDKPINTYVEGVFAGMGPYRYLVHEDGTSNLDPSLPSFLKVSSTGEYGYIKSLILPAPYCRTATRMGSGELGRTDVIRILREQPVGQSPPEVDASMKLGNSLPSLGFTFKSHPFFRDMWINAHVVGNWKPSLLDAIGNAVGGRIRIEKGTPTTYYLEPDVDEIRRRALATIEFFSPIAGDSPSNFRERIRYNLIKNSNSEFLKKWIDATTKPTGLELSNDDLGSEIRKYRSIFFSQLRKQSPELPFLKKYSDDEIFAMPVYVDLCGYLELDIRLDGPDGTPIHI